MLPKPIKFGRMSRLAKADIDDFIKMAVERRDKNSGVRPKGIRRGRPLHSRNKLKK